MRKYIGILSVADTTFMLFPSLEHVGVILFYIEQLYYSLHRGQLIRLKLRHPQNEKSEDQARLRARLGDGLFC
jgi:hypothetical protein